MTSMNDFGQFDPRACRTLPEPMRREAALLNMERDAVEDASLSERQLRWRTARAMGVTGMEFAAIVDGASRFSLTSDDVDEGMADPIRSEREGRPGSLSAAVVSFAQIHLFATDTGSLDMASAYRAFQAFCTGRGEAALPRTQFGAELLVMARPTGGCRAGAILTGLGLRPSRSAQGDRV